METPAAIKQMNGWVKHVYTAAQQDRLGVDEDGRPLRPRTVNPNHIAALHEKSVQTVDRINRTVAQEGLEPMNPPADIHGVMRSKGYTVMPMAEDGPPRPSVNLYGVPHLGTALSRIEGAKEVFSEMPMPDTGEYCRGDQWYWNEPQRHGKYTFQSPRTDYRLTPGSSPYGECYGRKHAMGYPYEQWRLFPFDPNHSNQQAKAAYLRTHPSAPYKCVTRGAKINQAASEQWLQMEAEIEEAINKRKTHSKWLQANYGSSYQLPCNQKTFIGC